MSTTEAKPTAESVWTTSSNTPKQHSCDEIGQALDSGHVGDIVAKHEKLILQYYEDVQKQATESFRAAKMVAILGFTVLILTWLYTLGLDLVRALPNKITRQDQTITANSGFPGKNTAVNTGVISGILIEFIAGVNFWLYSKASKQFGFHICLERTYRYLVAYKIAEELDRGGKSFLKYRLHYGERSNDHIQ